MINKILDAISNALNEEFGDEYEIYSEDIKQDLKEPCFFIICLNPSRFILTAFPIMLSPYIAPI